MKKLKILSIVMILSLIVGSLVFADYNNYPVMANKYLMPDGSIQTFSGVEVSPADATRANKYKTMAPSAAKWLMPDGSLVSALPFSGGGGSVTGLTDASNVAITGGTVNNTVIGGTTPAAGTFTDLKVGANAVLTSLNIDDTKGNGDTAYVWSADKVFDQLALKQVADADLTTYAGITPSANVQTFLGSADFAAMRTNLSLVPGTNVQAYDADLTYLAGFTPTANVKTILEAANNAAIKTSLGYYTSGDLPTFASVTLSKSSGVAGDMGLYEANSTDTSTAGYRGPASLTYSYRGQFPNTRAAGTNRVLAWSNSGETGTGTDNDPYIQALSWVDLGGYSLLAHTKQNSATPVIDDADNFAANFTGDNLYGGTFIVSAAGTVVLPEPVAGMNFTIVLEGANATIIDPLGTGTADAIIMNGLAAADDENITSSTSGAMCVFQYRSANHWMATCNGFAEATPP